MISSLIYPRWKGDIQTSIFLICLTFPPPPHAPSIPTHFPVVPSRKSPHVSSTFDLFFFIPKFRILLKRSLNRTDYHLYHTSELSLRWATFSCVHQSFEFGLSRLPFLLSQFFIWPTACLIHDLIFLILYVIRCELPQPPVFLSFIETHLHLSLPCLFVSMVRE